MRRTVNATLNIDKLFLASRDIAADKAIVDALPHVPGDRQRDLLRILFVHREYEALESVPTLFHHLSRPAQSDVIANAAHLFGALRVTSRHSETQTRLNSIQIIQRSLNPRLAYLAAIALNDGAVQVRSEAAATLRILTMHHWRSHMETRQVLLELSTDAPNPDAMADRDLAHAIAQTLQLIRDERGHLLEALRDAVGSFDTHHRTEVLQAAMLLADELEPSLFHPNTLKRGKITQAMMELFTDQVTPELAPFVYIALGHPEPRRRVLNALAATRNDEFFVGMIRYHWLAREPRIRRGLAHVRSLAWLADPMHAAFSLPADAATLAPGWLINLGIPTDQKIALLRQFTLIDNPAANQAAIWALVQINVPASTLALQEILDHECLPLRKIAELELKHRRRIEDRIVPTRLNRPEGWARMLHRAAIDEDFTSLWNRFDQLDPREARASGACALRYISGFATQAQVRLVSNQAVERLRAVRLIVALDVASKFAHTLFNMASDPDPEVRAATLGAVAQVHDETARRILERALADGNPLVQTAAIDALDEINDRRRAELVAPFCNSLHAPVRAAAVRVLLRLHQPEGANELIKLLTDPRPDHRCHALWTIDLLKLAPLRTRVIEMCQNDPDPRIERIAHHVARRLARTAEQPRIPPQADPTRDSEGARK